MRWLVKRYEGVLERFCNIPGLNSIYFIFNDMISLFLCSFISPNWLRVRGRKKKLISRILCSRQKTDTKTTRVYSSKSSRIFAFLFQNSQTEFVRLRLFSKGYGSPADTHDQYSCIINTSIHDVTHTHAVLWLSNGANTRVKKNETDLLRDKMPKKCHNIFESFHVLRKIS